MAEYLMGKHLKRDRMFTRTDPGPARQLEEYLERLNTQFYEEFIDHPKMLASGATMGVNTNVVISFTFGLGSALAAAAGIFYALLYPAIDPFMNASSIGPVDPGTLCKPFSSREAKFAQCPSVLRKWAVHRSATAGPTTS